MASSDYLLCDECKCKIVYADHIDGVLCPKCVLSLIDRAEAAEAERDGLKATLQDFEADQAAEDRIDELMEQNTALQAEVARMREALEELIEVSDLRGDIDEIPHPCDDPKLWTARLIDAWDNARSALEVEP